MISPTTTGRGSVSLVLSAPSGAGKTTLARGLLTQFPEARISISHTTRPPRGRERDGVDYHFVDVPTFRRMVAEGQFLEWAEVHGNLYGSSMRILDEAQGARSIAIFDIDVQGGAAIKQQHPDAALVFILPPSMAVLEERLRARGTDAEATIQRRLSAARSEIERGVATYDYLLINDRLDEAADRLRAIVIAERCRRGNVDLTAFGSATT